MSKATLNASRADEFLIRPNDINVEIRVITNPDDPEYDDRVLRPVDPDLVESLAEVGQLQAARGYKLPGKNEDGQQVVVLTIGRGRWAAIQELWRHLVTQGADPEDFPPFRVCVVRYADAIRKVEEAIVENVHRDPIEQISLARKCRAYLNRVGESTKARERARMLFRLKSLVAMDNLLSLLDATPAVQQAVAEGKISPTLAMHVSKIDPEKQDAFVESVKDNSRPPSVSEGREKICELQGKGVVVALPSRKMVEQKLGYWRSDLESTLNRLAGPWPGDDSDTKKKMEERAIHEQGRIDALEWILKGGDR